MITKAVLTFALVGLGGVLVLLVVATAARKALRDMGDRRLTRRRQALRPLLIRMVAGDAEDAAQTLLRCSRAEARVLPALAEEMLGKLRGEGRHALVRVLEARGIIESARRRSRRPGALGRARAAGLLGEVGDSGSFADLGRLLSDRVTEVRLVAARALGKLGEPAAVPLLLSSLDGIRPLPGGLVAMALVRTGTAGVPALRDALNATSATTRAVAADVLGLLGAVAATDDLVEVVVSDGEAEVRVRAAAALGRIGGPRAVAPLSASLGSDIPSVLCAAAAEALGQLGADEAVPRLAAALDDPTYSVAHSAARALASIGPAGHAALTGATATARSGAPHAREALARLALVGADGETRPLMEASR